MKLHETKTYQALIFDLIQGNQVFSETLSLDKDGNPCIGYGFNLRSKPVFTSVLKSFGFDVHGEILRGDALEAEFSYIKHIQQVLRSASKAGRAITATNLDAVMTMRYNDSRYRISDGFYRRETFAYDDMHEALFAIQLIADTCECELDAWLLAGNGGILNSNPGLFSHDKKERVALISMVFRGTIQVNADKIDITMPELHQALNDDNRVEAWFQIRYQSVPGLERSERLVKYAYYESELFGLYNKDINKMDLQFRNTCKLIYQTYKRYRSFIMEYEKCHMTLINQANLQFGLTGINRIRTLEQNFQIAYDTIRATTRLAKNGKQLQAMVYIEKGNAQRMDIAAA